MYEYVNQPNTTVDILILSAPLTITNGPMAAGAVLKAVAEQAGFSCSSLDLNILTMKWVLHHQDRDDIVDYFDNGLMKPNVETAISQYTNSVVALINTYNPKIVGFSVFTYQCRNGTELLCKALRTHCPDIQIIIGGAGIVDVESEESSFADNLKKNNLIDHYIKGDAEHTFVEFLKGNDTFPGINASNWQQLTRSELATLPYPNYDDYKWSWYGKGLFASDHEFKHGKKIYSVGIPITGSKGCVRNCTFCDFIISHKIFTWRTAENIFDEIIHQQKKYKQNAFSFTDSLINGNMKEYRRLITMLANYNDSQRRNNRITWYSQFIMRPKGQFTEELWELTARSGAQMLAIGIESFDDKVRFEMGKTFTNEDISYGLSMMKKYGIKAYFMFIIGYVTETQEIYEQVRQWLQDRVEYKDMMTLGIVGTLAIIKGTPLDKMQDKLGVIWVKDAAATDFRNSLFNWATSKNTPAARAKWMEMTYTYAEELGFNLYKEAYGHEMLYQMAGGNMPEAYNDIAKVQPTKSLNGSNTKVLF